MKNILSHSLWLAAITMLLAACAPTDDAQRIISELDREAEARKKEIRSTPTTFDKETFSTIYYISQEGSDLNDGLSPETAIQSLTHLNSLDLKEGDCVLFKASHGMHLEKTIAEVYGA